MRSLYKKGTRRLPDPGPLLVCILYQLTWRSNKLWMSGIKNGPEESFDGLAKLVEVFLRDVAKVLELVSFSQMCHDQF